MDERVDDVDWRWVRLSWGGVGTASGSVARIVGVGAAVDDSMSPSYVGLSTPVSDSIRWLVSGGCRPADAVRAAARVRALGDVRVEHKKYIDLPVGEGRSGHVVVSHVWNRYRR